MPLTESLACAHARLTAVLDPGRDGEDPDQPETVQAMPIVLNLPKTNPPPRLDVLAAAAKAVVAACLDPRAGEDSTYAADLQRWYGARIRKIARRARNSQWDRVQVLPGVTATCGSAQARAFVPSAVQEVDPLIGKLQIGGTDVPPQQHPELRTGVPLIAVDAGLGMSVGKAAAQVGHGSMLLAAHMSLPEVTEWADSGFDLQVCEVPRSQFSQLAAREGAVLVRDAGYTEVAPGSVTVVALRHG